jgi:hypothetical protein
LILPFFSSIWGENAMTHFHLGRNCHCINFYARLCWFTFQPLREPSSGYPKNGKNVIRLPENWEKRHPVTRKLGKTSSGYPKSGKNVIQLPENWEKRHPVDLCQYV